MPETVSINAKGKDGMRCDYDKNNNTLDQAEQNVRTAQPVVVPFSARKVGRKVGVANAGARVNAFVELCRIVEGDVWRNPKVI
jgi:hypothetical protein